MKLNRKRIEIYEIKIYSDKKAFALEANHPHKAYTELVIIYVAFLGKGERSLLENNDNDTVLKLIAINKLSLSDVKGPSQTSIKVPLIVVF